MAITLKPMETLVLWALIARGGEGLQKDIKPRIDKKLRDGLERAGLVVSRKNSNRAIIIEVTDKGWAFAADNLDAELPARSTAAGPIMQAFLHHLKRFLKSRNIAFAEIFMTEAEIAPAGKQEKSKPGAEDIKERIRDACLSLANGRSKQRIRLYKLRKALPDIERGALDQALLDMQQKEELVLIGLANKQDITDADRAAELKIGGNPRHVVYFGV